MRTFHPALPIVAASFLLAACSGRAPVPAATDTPVPAEVVMLRSEPVPAVLQAPGTVQPRDRIVLSAQINGFVREVRVNPGNTVAAGQTLVVLDARDADSQKEAAQASIQEAQAALAEARRGLEMAQSMRTAAKSAADLASATLVRYQKLFDSRSVAPQELDEVRARRDEAAADLAAKDAMVAAAQERLRQSEARIAQANAQSRRADVYVSWTVVKAPATGRVVERSVDPGTAIFPGSPLITLESISRPQVLASLPTTDAAHVRSGMEVQVRIAAGKPINCRISEIIPLSTPGSHTVQFKADLPNDVAEVSGSYATVEIPAGMRQAILVPLQAVRESGQLTGVFVVDSSAKARFRLVKTIAHDSGRVELLAGVQPGERVVANLNSQIVDGVSLEIR